MRLIHRLWLGPKPMPAAYVQYGHEWARLNPAWEVVDWLGQGIDATPTGTEPANYRTDIFYPGALANRDIYDSLRHGAVAPVPMDPDVAIATQRADVAGYEIVYRRGGLYVNCDMQPLNPLSCLRVPLGAAVLAREDQHYLSNAAMYADPGHPFFRRVILELPRRYRDMPGAPMNKVTGPYLLTEVYLDWTMANPRHDIWLADREAFNPVSYTEVPIGGDAREWVRLWRKNGSVAMHHWGHRGQQA